MIQINNATPIYLINVFFLFIGFEFAVVVVLNLMNVAIG